MAADLSELGRRGPARADVELTVAGLSFGYGDTPVLNDVSLPAVRAGTVTALVGPNAAGKSTLLRCIAGLHRYSGRVRCGAPGAEAAPDAAPGQGVVFYLPQENPAASSLTVFEAVLLARTSGGARRGAARRDAEHDTGRALAGLDLDGLANRRLAELSGGQRQLVGLAQAMVRRPAVLLLDEPTSALDLRNQLQILARVRSLAVEQPAAVVITVHDLNLSARFADQVVVLDRGEVRAAGPPREVLTRELLREVYRIEADVARDADGEVTVTARRSL
jgi:iron complex transport system ATP-binding protein